MKIFIYLLILFTLNSHSQDNILRIEYDFNLSIGQYQQYKSTLYINKESSLFLWKKPNTDNNYEDENNIVVNLNKLDSLGAFNYRLLSKDSLYSRMVYLKKEIILLEEKTPKIDWQIKKEQKKIGAYNCQKAIANFRGRKYIAWFTKDIPINAGPWKLQGLPGLILEAHDTLSEIVFSVSSISKTNYKINPSLIADKIINLEDYKEIKKTGLTNFIKKFKTKFQRGVEVKITSTKQGMEIFE